MRGSTEMRRNFQNKTHSTSQTNKTFYYCDIERGFKIKHGMSKAKNLTKIKAKLH